MGAPSTSGIVSPSMAAMVGASSTMERLPCTVPGRTSGPAAKNVVTSSRAGLPP